MYKRQLFFQSFLVTNSLLAVTRIGAVITRDVVLVQIKKGQKVLKQVQKKSAKKVQIKSGFDSHF